ncbi:MAG: fructokinase, partial [bacterium]|nr:fructokinase [bacterium]
LVLGGGVIQARPMLLPLIARRSADLLNLYIEDLDAAALERLIVAPGLGADAGPLGAILLGQQAAMTRIVR